MAMLIAVRHIRLRVKQGTARKLKIPAAKSSFHSFLQFCKIKLKQKTTKTMPYPQYDEKKIPLFID